MDDGWTTTAGSLLRKRHTIAIAGIFAAAAIGTVWLFAPPTWRTAPLEQLAKIAAAAPHRAIEPRLSGAFPHAPLGGAKRGSSRRVSDSGMPALKAAAGTYVAAADPHLAGVANLLYGNHDRALSLLKRATTRGTADAWSDLAAAFLVSAEETGSSLAAIDALAAADEARRLDLRHPSAAFNRALALQRLGLWDEALPAWNEYRALDRASGWSSEAAASASRLEEELNTSQWPRARVELEAAVKRADHTTIARIVTSHARDARAWAESAYPALWAEAVRAGKEDTARVQLDIARAIGHALRATSGEQLVTDAVRVIDESSSARRALLVDAYLTYRDGRMSHAANAADAVEKLDLAAKKFARAGCPLQWLAQYYHGAAVYAQQKLDDALAILDPLASARFSKRGYLALEAQIGWERGLATLARGSPSAAATIFQESEVLFDQLNEPSNAAIMQDFNALRLDMTGDAEAAWRIRIGALAQFARARDPQRKTLALRSAATAMIVRQDWTRARPLLDLAIATATRANDTSRLCASLAHRSAVLAATGDEAQTRRDLAALNALISRVSDSRVRAGLLVDAHFAEAFLLRERDPVAAIAHLSHAVEYLDDAGHALFLSRVYLERGRLHRRRGDIDAARSDVVSGLEWTERTRRAIIDPQLRAVASRSAEELFHEGIGLALDQGEENEAFALAERARGRSLLESFQGHDTALPLSAADIQRALAPTAAIVEYAHLHDHLVAFVITAHDTRVVVTALSQARLREMAAATGAAVRGEGDLRALEDGWNVFIRPIAMLLEGVDRLAVAPDRFTATVPFAALRDSHRQRYLIDDHLVTIAPSASLAVLCSKRATHASGMSILSIGATEFDRDQIPNAEPLPMAASEARRVRTEYRVGTLLSASSATVRAVVDALPNANIVHFAGHSIAPTHDPAASALLLSPRGLASMLTAREIGRLQMRETRLVVLSSCRSAAAGPVGDGIESLATAFIVAGVPSVIGAMWDVADRTAADLAVILHREYRTHGDAARAFRDTVLQQPRTADVPPRWAVITPFGGFPGLISEGER